MQAIANIHDTFCRLDELPALPAVAMKILEKIKDPETPMHQLAEILATDPPLSAKVLNVVNSSFFALPRKITNLPHAVNLLGEESLKYIALSFSLIKMFDQHRNKIDYALFWKSSLTSAVVCRIIGRELDRADCEDLYFLGLIHNIGIMALFQTHPREYGLVLDKVRREDAEFHVAENEIFGCNHMQVGAFLIDHWGLPEAFSLPVAHHHHPAQLGSEDKNDLARTRILHIAFEISRFINDEGKVRRLALIEELLREYDPAGKIRLPSVFSKVSEQLEPLLPLFDLETNNNIDYLELLEDSKKEMFNLSLELTRQIKDQQKSLETLSVLASQDGLTRLLNHQSFQEALDREIAGTRRYNHSSVLALADLDTFKTINDRHGHAAGDHVLQAVARFFTENTRKSDIVARYGGEEFVFILSRTSLEDGFKILDRIRADLAGLSIAYEGQKLSVTMSVGVTLIAPEKAWTKNQLLKQADAAMYLAKKAGRNQTLPYKSD